MAPWLLLRCVELPADARILAGRPALVWGNTVGWHTRQALPSGDTATPGLSPA